MTYKTFLDSVHGRIKLPQNLCDDIVDTCEFQRLRRIEQNSCRAVFPSARHDRFIHSIGVYHVGDLIVKHLEQEMCEKPDNWEVIADTYKTACLLHDVGHTPFSHTFEEFYDSVKILEELRGILNSKTFISNTNISIKNLTPHELLSAWVACKAFKDCESCKHIDWELLVRMIIGVPYSTEERLPIASDFRNIMIELIHGTIDADGLDYVCRDVWAGGYHNFSVDLYRLIDSIKVIKRENGEYVLAFSSKAINEIETVLNVKNFQFFYVLNHHKVLLEQHYLIEGVKNAACYHLNIADGDEAIRSLCDYTTFLTGKKLVTSNYNLIRPCDDDFVVLMKQANAEQKCNYIEQWFSRRHSLIPLWKSKMEFSHLFKEVFEKIADSAPAGSGSVCDNIRAAEEMVCSSIGQAECIAALIEKLGIEEDQVFVREVKPKLKKFDPEKIKIWFNNEVFNYNSHIHEGFMACGYNVPFYYFYLEQNVIDSSSKQSIIQALKEILIKKQK